MSYPSVSEFKEILLKQPLRDIAEQYIFKGVPYVFRTHPDKFSKLRDHLCRALQISEENIAVVGSAQIGFSLSPDTFSRKFLDDSDIDVVVMSEHLFDRVWMTLLEWHYRRRYSLGGSDWEWFKKRRADIYWGWIRPDKIRFQGLSFPKILEPLRDISTRWFDTFQSFSNYPDFAARTVSGPLYRSREHAIQYHVEALRQIRESIKPKERSR